MRSPNSVEPQLLFKSLMFLHWLQMLKCEMVPVNNSKENVRIRLDEDAGWETLSCLHWACLLNYPEKLLIIFDVFIEGSLGCLHCNESSWNDTPFFIKYNSVSSYSKGGNAFHWINSHPIKLIAYLVSLPDLSWPLDSAFNPVFACWFWIF